LTVPLFHTNDIHGGGFPSTILFPEEDKNNGGLFALAALINKRREELWKVYPDLMHNFLKTAGNDGILTLDAGDSVSGTYDDAQSVGLNMIKLMNSSALDYDAVTIGNHSSDYGLEPLMMNISWRNCPVVLSNAKDVDTDDLIQGTVLSTVSTINGIRFGIFALTHDRSTRIPGIKISAIEMAAKQMLPRLRKKSDIIVLLSHLGLDKEKHWCDQLGALDDDNPLMNIDIIIDGHSHSRNDFLLDEDTLVAQAGSYGHVAGEITLKIDPVTKKLVSADVKRHDLSTVNVNDSKSLQLERPLIELNKKLNFENQFVLVKNLHDFYFAKTSRSAPGIENRASEFVARSLCEIPFGSSIEQADIGMVYQKGVRDKVASNDKGEITNDILHRIVPFGEPVVIIKQTGTEIEKLVKKGLVKKFSWAGLQVKFKEITNKKGYVQRKLISLKVFDRQSQAFVLLEPKQVYRLGAVGFFSKVFVRPPSENVLLCRKTNKEILLEFLKKYATNREQYFTQNDPMWPCNIYE